MISDLKPEDMLREAAFPPFTASSALIARRFERAREDHYVEPLSVNGHAFLAVERADNKIGVIVAVRLAPLSQEEPVYQEWKLTWSRWVRVREQAFESGIPIRLSRFGDMWMALTLDVPSYEVTTAALLIGLGRSVAGLTSYVGYSDDTVFYDYFYPENAKASERIQETLAFYFLFLLTALETEYEDEGTFQGIFKLIQILVDNALYMSFEEPEEFWDPIGEAMWGSEETQEYGATINNISKLLVQLYDVDPTDALASPSRPVLTRAIKRLETLGAARRCTVRIVDKDRIARPRAAVFFDLRHELVLTYIMRILSDKKLLGAAKANTLGMINDNYMDVACTLFPYILGVKHENWRYFPEGASVCRLYCKSSNSVCSTARQTEREGWPEKPRKPGPCHGVRPVLLQPRSL